MGSSPVALKYFLFIFFDLLVSLSLFLILCTTGYIYLDLACVYLSSTVNKFNKPPCDQLFARCISLRLLLSSADF